MASGKYERKQPKRTIKTYHKFEAKPEASRQQRRKSSQYKMKRRDKRRILALIAAIGTTAWISSHSSEPMPPATPANAAEIDNAVHMTFDEEHFEDSITNQGIVYTIGVGNYGAEITVDNPKTPEEDSYSIYDSFVIVSEDEAITSDVNGNFLKGQISNEDFTEVTQLTEEEMANYAFYQVVSESGTNVISDGSVISTVPSGDYVLAYKADTSEKYLKALCTSNGSLYEGNIEKNALKEIGDFEAISYRAEQNVNNIENMAMANTKTAEYINLKLREQPGQAIITEIPHGSFVHVLGETKQYGNKTWALVKYETPDGTEYEGWVASNYLSYDVVQEKPSPKVREGINVNSTGNVTGIDISGMSGKDLGELHENGISAQTVSVHGTFDTSQLEGKNGFAGIKLGASAYSRGNLNILEYNNYMEQVSLCEQKGIPYMFYYYSTSITEEEALKEVEIIEDRMNDLRQRCGLKYCLGVAVDKELAESTKPDRQRNGNIEEQTDALAKLINEIQRRGLSNYVFIYSPGRVMQPDLDQIFDLKSLSYKLDNPENVALWLTSLMYKNGNMTQNLKKDVDYADSCGFSTAITQVVLDAKVSSGEKYDINNMDFNWYKKLTSTLIEQSKTNHQTGITLNSPTEQNNNRYDDDLEI